MKVRIIYNEEEVEIRRHEFSDDTSDEYIDKILNSFVIIEESPKEQKMHKIAEYQKIAPTLLIDLYATNKLNGITTQESDAMVDAYEDVVFRLTQGLFPTALYRLEQKIPSGFVTQELIDEWKSIIKSYL